MLNVRTELKKSEIAGIGCFTTEFIPKGTIIWELNTLIDTVLTKEQYETLPKIAKEYYDNFCYYNELDGGYILCGDNGKYFNHSVTPNCIADKFQTISIRDIEIGEEITENYYSFDELAKTKLEP